MKLTNKLFSTYLPMLAAVSLSAQFDPPDLELESRMAETFKIRQQLGAEHTPLSGWIENYQIKASDNLWSLSQMLYGDGNYWPRIWAANERLRNPHLIRSGHFLHFMLGSEEEAPSFRFSEEAGGNGVELAAAPNEQTGVLRIPPPEVKPRPVISIPNSFPKWETINRNRFSGVEFDITNVKDVFGGIRTSVWLTGYVSETPIRPVGAYDFTETIAGLPQANQYIYVMVRSGEAQPGRHMLLVQDGGKLESTHPRRPHLTKDLYLVKVVGEVELVERANPNIAADTASKISGFEFFRARLVRVELMSDRSAMLVPGTMKKVSMSDQGPFSNVQAELIGSAKSATSGLYGPGEFVFLDKGSKDGLQEGQRLDVFIDRSTRVPANVRFSPIPSGRVKIVEVGPNVSTAVVLESKDGLQQGDRTDISSLGVRNRAESDMDDESDMDFEDVDPDLDSDYESEDYNDGF